MKHVTMRRLFHCVLLLLLALYQGACASSKTHQSNRSPQWVPYLVEHSAWFTSQLPSMAGFSARWQLDHETVTGGKMQATGEMFGSKGDLFLPLDSGKNGLLNRSWSGMSLVIQSNISFVLSEPLQGYAPITVTNEQAIFQELKADGFEVVAGQNCARYVTKVRTANGEECQVMVWRAVNLQDFPIRFTIVGDTWTSILLFSKVRFNRPSPQLFTVPSSFTRYADPDVLWTELHRRQQALRTDKREAIREETSDKKHGK